MIAAPEFTVLDRLVHAALSLDEAGHAAPHAGNSIAIAIGGGEVPAACLEYPCVFTLQPDGRWQVNAVTGLQADANLFTGINGRWEGDYMPVALRTWPFRLVVDHDEPPQLHLAVHLPALNDRGQGEALFDAERNNSPWLERRIQLLVQAQSDLRRTSALVEALAELGLLKERSMQILLPDGHVTTIEGFHVVDEDRLNGLDAGDLTRLHKMGGLALAYGHLLSLRNFQSLARRVQPN